MRITKQHIATVAVAAVAISGAGIAYAAWTSTGSGSGDAASEPISAVTFTAGTAIDKVYPTGASDIQFTVANPNRYNVALSGLAITSVAGTVGSSAIDTNGAEAGTGSADVTEFCDLSLATQIDADIVVKALSTVAPVTLADGLLMGNESDNACAGADFVVSLTSTATSTGVSHTTTNP